MLDERFLADPYGEYAKLREAAPVHRVTTPDGLAVWLVTRYADVRAALADPRLSLDKRHSRGGYIGFKLPPALDANLLNMDPPDHTRIRRLVAQAFTPRRVETLRPRIRQLAEELLDRVDATGEVDLVAAYALPLAIAVICDLIGIPPGDRRDFRSWTNALLAPEPGPDAPARARQAVASMLGFLTSLIARRRAEPADDLLSDMISARDAGDRLSEDELVSLVFLILFAGYENSVNLIANTALAALTAPETLSGTAPTTAPSSGAEPATAAGAGLSTPAAAGPAGPGGAGGPAGPAGPSGDGGPAGTVGAAAFVEEVLRWDPPATLAIRRFPVEDVEIGGVAIPAGDTVMLSLASANRDPGRFAEPDVLDPGRADGGHVSLGYGIHFCIGAPLARIEGEIALDTLLRRLPGLRLAVPVEKLEWLPSYRTRGLRSLPVTTAPAV